MNNMPSMNGFETAPVDQITPAAAHMTKRDMSRDARVKKIAAWQHGKIVSGIIKSMANNGMQPPKRDPNSELSLA